ncbi:MAG TPA: hypothetical protein VGO52_13150 [Hyphomonadaceae bacterium]|nr:hypothetical protein [Hyphomonadaceae bacterium]
MVGANGAGAGARWLIAISVTTPLAAPAFAGAWTQPAKSSLTIATVAHASVEDGDMWRTETLTESGFGGGWGMNLKIENEKRFASINDDRTGWRLGIQKSFALGDRTSAAIIANYIGGDSFDSSFCQGSGVETRAALGTSFEFLGREAFVNAEAGYRTREDQDCERVLGEIAFGMDVTPNLSATVKTWAEDGEEGRSAKVEASLLYDFGPLSVGLGWREEVSGAFEEKGWLVSAWKSF